MAFVHAWPQEVVEQSFGQDAPRADDVCRRKPESSSDSDGIPVAAQKPRQINPVSQRALSDERGLHFKREARLLTPAQFAPVFKNNHRSADKYWTLLFTRNNSDRPRLGMAVAKKKIKKAVDRNRVKRIVRESFRTNGSLAGVDIVVLPSAHSQFAGNTELRASLDKHWARIAIKCAAR